MNIELEVPSKQTEPIAGEDRTESANEHEQLQCFQPPRFDPNAAWVKEQFLNGDVTFF